MSAVRTKTVRQTQRETERERDGQKEKPTDWETKR